MCDDEPLRGLLIDERKHPTDEVLRDALVGAIGVNRESYQVITQDGLDERNFTDQLLTVLLGAYAAVRVEHDEIGQEGGWMSLDRLGTLLDPDADYIEGKIGQIGAIEQRGDTYRLKPTHRAVVASDFAEKYGRNSRPQDTDKERS